MRTVSTGATRNDDSSKPDYEGFLSVPMILNFGRYMDAHRKQADGQTRASDNWQKGIPKEEYLKSLMRHIFDLWSIHRGFAPTDVNGRLITISDACAAVWFNAQGYYHEFFKEQPRE